MPRASAAPSPTTRRVRQGAKRRLLPRHVAARLECVREILRPPPLRELIRLLERGKYLAGRNVEHSFGANDSVRVVRLGHRQLPPGITPQRAFATLCAPCKVLGYSVRSRFPGDRRTPLGDQAVHRFISRPDLE